RTHALQQIASLFDNLVSECQQAGRHGNAERLGGLEIDNEEKFARLLDREIAGLRAMQNLPGIDARTTRAIAHASRIGHQNPGAPQVRKSANTGLSRLCAKTYDARKIVAHKGLACDVDRAHVTGTARRKGAFQIVNRGEIVVDELKAQLGGYFLQ